MNKKTKGLLAIGAAIALYGFTKTKRQLYYRGRLIGDVISISKPDQNGFVKIKLKNIRDAKFSNAGNYNANDLRFVKTVAQIPVGDYNFYVVGI